MLNKYKPMAEGGNWDNSYSYSESIIMSDLNELHRYEKIAKFGAEDFYTDLFQMTPEIRAESRIKALIRFNEILDTLLSNTKFAVFKSYKNYIDKIYLELKAVKKNIPLTFYRQRKREKTITVIEERKFEIVLDMHIDLKTQLLGVLNRCDMIFRGSDTFDPKQYKADMVNRLKTQG